MSRYHCLWPVLAFVSAFVVVVSFSLSPAPASSLCRIAVYDDKVGHILAYFILSHFALRTFDNLSFSRIATVSLMIFAFSFSMEYAQTLLPNRHGLEASDLLANIVGIICASVSKAVRSTRTVQLHNRRQ
jgi:VanZ family protein